MYVRICICLFSLAVLNIILTNTSPYIHTYIHTYMHSCIPNVCSLSQPQTSFCFHYTQYIHTHINTCTHAYRWCVLSRRLEHHFDQLLTFTNTIHTYIHTYTLAFTIHNTYIYTYMHSCIPMVCSLSRSQTSS